MDMHPEQDHACGAILRLSEGSGLSVHQGSLFPQEKNPNGINHVGRIQTQQTPQPPPLKLSSCSAMCAAG